MLLIAIFVNKPSIVLLKLQGYCNLFQFLEIFGRMYPWISLRGSIISRIFCNFGSCGCLSLYAHFGAFKERFTATNVASLFTEIVVKHHSFPKSIVSDRDPIFLSRFWQDLFKNSGTSLHLSSAYHPQSDGQTEVLNQCLEQYLRSLVSESPSKGVMFSPWAELCYNTSFHSAILMSPFEAEFGILMYPKDVFS